MEVAHGAGVVFVCALLFQLNSTQFDWGVVFH